MLRTRFDSGMLWILSTRHSGMLWTDSRIDSTKMGGFWMLRYEDFQYTFRNVGSEFKSCVSLEIPWQETADMTKKIKSKYNSATAEKALPVGKQPAQQQPDAACQPGNEWVFRYELRYPSSCGPSLPAFIPTSASHSSQSIVWNLKNRFESEKQIWA